MNWVTHEHPRIDHIVRPWLTIRSIDDTPEFPIAGGPLSRLHYLARLLREWDERSRQRWHLQMLDDRMLQDIGLTPADVGPEVRKWFWMK
jgi:uncharacterized protein YjiS (DUF1127 family)